MIQATRLDHVAIGMHDLPRAVGWCRSVLGLEERFAGLWPEGPRMLGAGESCLALVASDPALPAGLLHVAFRVTAGDLDRARAELSDHVVRESDHGVSRSVYVSGPERLEIELTTYREGL